MRDHLASVVLGDDVDHDNAFLEHDVHSEALVFFFLEYFRSTHIVAPNGFKVVVYTRFDVVRDPLLFAITFGNVANIVGHEVNPLFWSYTTTLAKQSLVIIMIQCF